MRESAIRGRFPLNLMASRSVQIEVSFLLLCFYGCTNYFYNKFVLRCNNYRNFNDFSVFKIKESISITDNPRSKRIIFFYFTFNIFSSISPLLNSTPHQQKISPSPNKDLHINFFPFLSSTHFYFKLQ